MFNVVDDELLTGREFLKAYKKKARSLRSIRRSLLLLAYTMSLLGRNTPAGQKNSFHLSSTGAAALPNGKDSATPTRRLKERAGLEAAGPDGASDGSISGAISS